MEQGKATRQVWVFKNLAFVYGFLTNAGDVIRGMSGITLSVTYNFK